MHGPRSDKRSQVNQQTMDDKGKKLGSKVKRMRPSPASEGSQTREPNGGLYVVGVGGSAGGLEAFERLFAGMPRDTGIAFVVIQHLDPTHKALMPELLQRATALKVVEIVDGIETEPNCIFVLPPDHYVSIQEGRLWLSPATPPHGTRSPIDSFFTSLAADKKDKAIGIIVSGMGMDGTVGIKAIKEQLGAVMVQEPVSAKYDGMPSSAIATGIADYVAPVEDMPAILASYVQHASRPPGKAAAKSARAQSSLQRILDLLHHVTGHDFSLYKKGTLYRRIERRVSIHHLDSIASYARYLEENPNEANALFKDLVIGVTSFFRDPAAFEMLQNKVLPELLGAKAQDDAIRIWVAGCSTGEEAYSIIMALQESLDKMPGALNRKIQVFATDIDPVAIDTARKAIYPASTLEGVSPERLERFFVRTDGSYQVKRNIREAVVFAPHNIISGPPFTKLDVISCRNLLIYFSPELQKKLVPVFHYALNPDGILFLGSAETISGYANLFSTIDSKWKIYKRKEYPAVWTGMVDLRTAPVALKYPDPSAAVREVRGSVPDIAQRVLLEEYAPTAVVIDENGDILYVSGRTGKYLELLAGKTTSNLSAMACEGLRYELAAAVRKASTENAEVTVKGVSVTSDSGDHLVDLTVRPFSHPEGMDGILLVVFEESVSPNERVTADGAVGEACTTCPRCPELEQELKRTKHYLQTTIEEMQSTQEEMLFANEEYQSTNEELQITNEELMTSKEELQSLNEELTTVNTELQMKNEELTGVNNDMINLLNSTEIATIFLDTRLNIRRFTPSLGGIINLRPSDVGRPVAEIAPNLLYDALVSDAKHVLDTLAIKEAQVTTKEGLWYAMRMMPYRTLDNLIDGVVVTFSDITLPKRLEESLREGEKRYRTLFESMGEGFALCEIILDDSGKPCDWRYLDMNPAFEHNTGLKIDNVLGKTVREVLPNIEPYWIESYGRVALTGQPIQFEYRVADLNKYFEVHAFSPAGGRFAAMFVDITGRKRTESLMHTRLRMSELAQHAEIDELIRVALDEAEAQTGSCIGYFHLINEDQQHIILQEWSTNTLANMCEAEGKGLHYPISDAGVWVDCFHARAPVIHNDYASMPNKKGLPDGHAPVIRDLGVPVIRNGLVVAIMGVGNKASDYTQDDIDVVQSLAIPLTDLVAYKQTEETRQQLASIIEHTSDAVIGKTLDGTILTWNMGAEKMYGYSAEEAVGRSISILAPTDAPDDLLGVLERLRRGETVQSYETVRTRKSGTQVNVSITVSPVRNAAGEIVGASTIARDITETARLRCVLQRQHSEMQQALLPGKIPAFCGCEIAARFVPGTAGEQIGGDFYDVFETEDGKIAVLIGDVAGKGIEAGAMAAVTRSTVRAFAYELSSPGKALEHTNSVVCMQGFTNERFVTVFLAILDPVTGRLSYSSAGHPPAMILRRHATVEVLKAGSLPIRVQENVDYHTYEAELAQGDKLVIYTDGISEAHNHERMYDIEGIEKTLQYQPDSSPKEILDMLFCTAGDISEGTLSDDAAVIVLERTG